MYTIFKREKFWETKIINHIFCLHFSISDYLGSNIFTKRPACLHSKQLSSICIFLVVTGKNVLKVTERKTFIVTNVTTHETKSTVVISRCKDIIWRWKLRENK